LGCRFPTVAPLFEIHVPYLLIRLRTWARRYLESRPNAKAKSEADDQTYKVGVHCSFEPGRRLGGDRKGIGCALIKLSPDRGMKAAKRCPAARVSEGGKSASKRCDRPSCIAQRFAPLFPSAFALSLSWPCTPILHHHRAAGAVRTYHLRRELQRSSHRSIKPVEELGRLLGNARCCLWSKWPPTPVAPGCRGR
jgi:hypothetical protein